jgi:4-hydroxy-3-polyprenylbenzoate decarboxylase
MLLQNFIANLKDKGELIEVYSFVNPDLEIAEYTDRIAKTNQGGKAILFYDTGTDFPVLTNMMGSDKRMSMALRINSINAVGDKVKEIMNVLLNPDRYGKLKLLYALIKMGRIMPRNVRKGICQQRIMPEPDLFALPVLKCWPKDGGPFITLPVVHTVDPETGKRNVGMYRMQVFDKNTTGMHWHMHKDGASHFQKYKKAGKKMPVAVTLGGDPVYTYAATAPLPKDVDEYLLAGFLRSKPVKLVPCKTQKLRVPADVDIVIEGYVDPKEDLAWEGPFGDHTGFYSYADWYPKFHVTAITYKRNAVYPATLVGVPPQEDYYIAKATEKLFLPVLQKTILPELQQMHIPGPGVGHNLTLITFKKSYPGHALKVMHALWGAGQMMFNKVLVAFDPDVNLLSYKEVIGKIVRYVDVFSDIHLSSGPMDILEHATKSKSFGGKLFLDATQKKKENEENIDNSPYDLSLINETSENIVNSKQLSGENTWFPLLIIAVNEFHDLLTDDLVQSFLQHKWKPKGVIFVDNIDLEHNDYLLTWIMLSNFDPDRDMLKKNIDKENACAFFNCTRKKEISGRKWPDIAISDQKTIAAINEKIFGNKEWNIKNSPSEEIKKIFETYFYLNK